MPRHRQQEAASGRRRRRRRRSTVREERDYFEFASEDTGPGSDPQEQRSVGVLVLSVVGLILILCVTVIMRSCEVETFPI
jgi:hypothetical protein